MLRSLHSIYSTARDLIAFLRALVRGELFDEPGTLELMQGRWNRFGLPRDRGALRAPGWPIEYALGLMRFRLPSYDEPALGVRKRQRGPGARVSRWSRVARGRSNASATATYQES